MPVLNGGPLPTQYHEEIEGKAVFYLGEAENGFLDVVDRMLADPAAVERQVVERIAVVSPGALSRGVRGDEDCFGKEVHDSPVRSRQELSAPRDE